MATKTEKRAVAIAEAAEVYERAMARVEAPQGKAKRSVGIDLTPDEKAFFAQFLGSNGWVISVASGQEDPIPISPEYTVITSKIRVLREEARKLEQERDKKYGEVELAPVALRSFCEEVLRLVGGQKLSKRSTAAVTTIKRWAATQQKNGE